MIQQGINPMTEPNEIRFSSEGDAEAVIRGVEALLRELSGDNSRSVPGIRQAFEDLANRSGNKGGIIVASTRGTTEVAGLLTFSIQAALRLGGNYCLIQELWTEPRKRGQSIGSRLMAFLREHCTDRGITRIEVCLPPASFVNYAHTLSFYQKHGFRVLGPRLVTDLA